MATLHPRLQMTASLHTVTITDDLLDAYPFEGDPDKTQDILGLLDQPDNLFRGDVIAIVDAREYQEQEYAYDVPDVLILDRDRFLPIDSLEPFTLPSTFKIPHDASPTHWDDVIRELTPDRRNIRFTNVGVNRIITIDDLFIANGRFVLPVRSYNDVYYYVAPDYRQLLDINQEPYLFSAPSHVSLSTSIDRSQILMVS